MDTQAISEDAVGELQDGAETTCWFDVYYGALDAGIEQHEAWLRANRALWQRRQMKEATDGIQS